MSQRNSENRNRIIAKVALVASILIGVTFLVSGTGKIAGVEETPAQVVDFITSIVPEFFLTPLTISFLYQIFIPYIVPWAEVILGLLLIIGFMPRLMAVLCLPLLLAFMGTNIWSIIQGGYVTCASCFGIWEKIFGSLTPLQSLIYDLVLLAFALVVIVLHRGGFFSSRNWLTAFVQKSKPAIRNYCSLSGLAAAVTRGIRATRQRPRAAIGAGIGIIGLALVVYGVTALSSGAVTEVRQDSIAEPVISNVAISEVSERGAVIFWMTDRPAISVIQVYDEAGAIILERIDRALVTEHRITIDGLKPGTLYYLEIAASDTAPSLTLSKQHQFTTQAVATRLLISNVRVAEIKESSVTIVWTTNKPAIGEVEYWVAGSSEKNTVSDDKLVVTHSVRLSSLNPEAIYSFRIRSVDAEGKQAASEKEETFTLAVGARVGMRAPDFTLDTLDGKSVKLSDYRGKVVMLDFWIWTCSGCREKLTIIQEAFKEISAETMAILCIHVEGRTTAINNYALSAKLTVPILLDMDGAVAERYGVTGFPTIFFVDGDGFARLVDPQFGNATELKQIFDTVPGAAPKSKSAIPDSLRITGRCC